MKQHRIRMGIVAGAVGMAVALAPMAVASASLDKGKNPNSKLCVTLRSESGAEAKLSTSMESAIESGNFSTAKAKLLSALSTSQKEAGTAKGLLSSAPSNVRSAFNVDIGFLTQIKKAIQNSTSFTSLEQQFVSLGEAPKLQKAGKTLTGYITTQCGSVTTTT